MKKFKPKWFHLLVIPVLILLTAIMAFVPWREPVYPCGAPMLDAETGELLYPNGFLAYQGD